MDSTPTGVGGQYLRCGRPVLGREEVAGRDDLAHREGTEPALDEATPKSKYLCVLKVLC